MRAALLTEFNQPLVIEEVATKPLGDRDVRVRIDASGVCHSDVTIAAGGIPMMELPVILGHEGAGTILETGPDVTRVRTGDRVIMALFPVCGNCFHCIRDESHLCETLGEISATARMTRSSDGSGLRSLSALGTFADEAVIHESLLVKVDTDLPARGARAARLRRDDRGRRRAQHREGHARCDGRRRRVRRGRPVGAPGRPHRRCVAHLRRRPGRAEAQDRGAVGRHRPDRPERR